MIHICGTAIWQCLLISFLNQNVNGHRNDQKRAWQLATAKLAWHFKTLLAREVGQKFVRTFFFSWQWTAQSFCLQVPEVAAEFYPLNIFGCTSDSSTVYNEVLWLGGRVTPWNISVLRLSYIERKQYIIFSLSLRELTAAGWYPSGWKGGGGSYLSRM